MFIQINDECIDFTEAVDDIFVGIPLELFLRMLQELTDMKKAGMKPPDVMIMQNIDPIEGMKKRDDFLDFCLKQMKKAPTEYIKRN